MSALASGTRPDRGQSRAWKPGWDWALAGLAEGLKNRESHSHSGSPAWPGRSWPRLKLRRQSKKHKCKDVESSWLPAKMAAYVVSISWLLGLAFLYRLRFLTKIFLDWQLTLTTQLCTSKLPDNPVNGLHVLDRPRLAGVKTGKNWQGKAEHFGLQLACTGWGQKLVKLAKEPRPAWPGSSYRVSVL